MPEIRYGSFWTCPTCGSFTFTITSSDRKPLPACRECRTTMVRGQSGIEEYLLGMVRMAGIATRAEGR